MLIHANQKVARADQIIPEEALSQRKPADVLLDKKSLLAVFLEGRDDNYLRIGQ